MLVHLRVAQLLCSRLCHDLLGPVGAVNAGMELIDEGDNDREAMALIARSGQVASRRLAFYRAAFGLGAGRETSLAEASALASGLLADGTVSLDWPRAGGPAPETPVGSQGLQLLLNLVLLGAESLPRGGTLEVRLAEIPEGLGVAMTAAGDGARLKDHLVAAMAPDVAGDALTAHTVQGYLTARLADSLGATVEVSDGQPREVHLATVLPTARD